MSFKPRRFETPWFEGISWKHYHVVSLAHSARMGSESQTMLGCTCDTEHLWVAPFTVPAGRRQVQGGLKNSKKGRQMLFQASAVGPPVEAKQETVEAPGRGSGAELAGWDSWAS